MKPFRALTAIEQLAAYLRAEVQDGAIGETMPGVHRLAKELGVGHKSVVAAVAQLQHEGLVIGQGARQACRILPPTRKARTGLNIRILLYEKSQRTDALVINLRHHLAEAGHQPEFSNTDLQQLKMNHAKVAKFVQANPADCWVVCGGSVEVIEWFANQPIPSFAFFGRHIDLPIAGVAADKPPAMRVAVRRLYELGHRRIVMLVRKERRIPRPGLTEQAFLDELCNHGIQTGPYHMPEWEESRVGFQKCLESLFQHTPPTALIISEPPLFLAAQHHLACHGIAAPEKISLICDDPSPAFEWFEPAISHFHWDLDVLLRSVVRWANEVASGKRIEKKTFAVASFDEGGTIGLARS